MFGIPSSVMFSDLRLEVHNDLPIHVDMVTPLLLLSDWLAAFSAVLLSLLQVDVSVVLI